MRRQWLDSLEVCPLGCGPALGEPSAQPTAIPGTSKRFGCGLRLLVENETEDLYADFTLEGRKYWILVARGNEILAHNDIRRLLITAIHNVLNPKANDTPKNSPQLRTRSGIKTASA